MTAREVLARAEKRLTSHIATHGIDARCLAIAAGYERQYARALAGQTTTDPGATLVDATREERAA